MDQGKLVQLLQATQLPDTDTVKKATVVLKRDYYTEPEALVYLLQIATSHDDVALRQLASTQCFRMIYKKWQKVPDPQKPQIRNHLLQSTFKEQVPKVRHANSRLIAAVAKLDLVDAQWADLPSLLQKAAVSSTASEREVSTYILFSILEEMGDDFSSKFSDFFALYSKTIKDPESAEVRMNTMLGLSRMAMIVDVEEDEESLEAIQRLLPEMVGVLRQAVDAGNEEMMLKGFEVFQQLLECDSRLLNKPFKDLVIFMAQMAGDHSLNKDARVQAQNFLITSVMYRTTRFQALRIGDQMIKQILEILTECGGTPEADDDEDELSLELATLSLLGIMSSHLAPTQVVAPLVSLFKQYSDSQDARMRQAGIIALGTCVEGAPEFVDTQLPELIPVIIRLLNDPEIKVREASTRATKELADCVAETLGKEHQQFIAALVMNLRASMQLLSGADSKTAASIVVNCCTALDSFVDGLKPEDVTQYLPQLVPNLSKLFEHPDIKFKSAAIGAVGSIAEAAQESFQPYFSQSMNALSQNIQIKDSDEEMDLRSMTVDAMGSMALAVGPEAFKQYVQPLMRSTEEGLHLDNPRLKETSYMFWGTLAKVYKTDFKPFLEGVVKGLFDSLAQAEDDIEVELGEEAPDLVGQEVTIAGKKVKVVDEKSNKSGGVIDVDDDDDDDDDDDWADMTGVSPLAEEKEIALEAIGEVITSVGKEFLPYFEKAMELILALVDHPYEQTRRAAISTVFRSYSALFQLQAEAQQKWQPGLPPKVQPSEEIAKLGHAIMDAVLPTWMAEDDKAVCLEINRNIAETLKLTGPHILSGDDVIQQVTQTLTSIVQKKHVCQQEFDEEQEAEAADEEDESSEDDWYVIETALDAIAGLAVALGSQFGELFKVFEKPLLGFASGSESTQRSQSVGCLADCIKGMKEGITPFTSKMLKLLLHRLSDEDPLTKSNAAFAVGLLVEHSQNEQETVKAYGQILGKLEPMLRNQEMRQLDNAAGCVSRMIIRSRHSVPLGDVLPALLGLLPLKEDYEENEPVYSMIVKLYQDGDSTIQGLTPQLIPVFEQVMGEPEEQITPEVREKLTQLVQYIQSKH